jgi:Asp-tRNA(Asn)/Glu-tRNA(Gln) amidotransferase A subunit family amidase
VALLLQVLAGDDPHDPACVPGPVPDYAQALLKAASAHPLRLGLVREFFLERADEETRKHIESIAEQFVHAGAQVEEIKMPASFKGAPEAAFQMLFAETAASHREVYAEHKARYSPQMQDVIEKGQQLSAVDYVETRRHQQRFRYDLIALCQTVDALLTPSTPAPAPHGLSTTGDPAFNGLASFTGLPSLGIPSGLSAKGLPFGMQLMAGAFAEEKLLQVGKWCEQVLGFDQRPPVS